MYFDEIKSGKKRKEYRDSHITFICEETGEQLRKDVISVYLAHKSQEKFPSIIEGEYAIVFLLDDDLTEDEKMNKIKELERLIEFNRLQGEMLIWEQHILIDNLEGEEKRTYIDAIEDNKNKIEKLKEGDNGLQG